MADIEVIYDPIKEMACIIDVDTRQGWGPAMIGPEAGTILQAFVDSVPFDITLFDSYRASDAFAQFLDSVGARVAATQDTPDTGTMEPEPDTGMVGADAPSIEPAIQADIDNAGSSADTDTEPTPAPTPQVIECYNCNGTGRIEFGGDEPSQRCNMCQGTGRILS